MDSEPISELAEAQTEAAIACANMDTAQAEAQIQIVEAQADATIDALENPPEEDDTEWQEQLRRTELQSERIASLESSLSAITEQLITLGARVSVMAEVQEALIQPVSLEPEVVTIVEPEPESVVVAPEVAVTENPPSDPPKRHRRKI